MAQLLKLVLIILAVLLISTNSNASMSTAASAYFSRELLSASSSSSSDEEGPVVRYWEAKLHDVAMPPMLSAMVTPLKAKDARLLVSKITHPGSSYLPSNAPAFCKSTRIICDRTDYVPNLANQYQTGYGAFNVRSEEVGPGGHGFFREKQTLVKGARIELSINKDDDGRFDQPRAFLPRELAQLFPFTKDGLPQLARMLSISKQALPTMQETVSDCFSPQGGLPGEIKSCPTSLEAMADFVTSTMGSQKPMGVLDVSSHTHHSTQEYSVGTARTVLDVKTVKANPSDKYVTCHDMFFPFRVFYCHYLPQTKLFVATLQASDGSIHDRAAVCHYDTSLWNANHVSFSDLGTKPGQSEACHWMADNGLVFLHQ